MRAARHRYPLLVRLLIGIVVPLAVSAIFFGNLLGRSLAQEEGYVRLSDLADAVTIATDEYGIPHISAKTDRDAFFALGYVHAQNRLWQMERQRRLGQGRLSELFGESTLPIDKQMRTLGLAKVAAQNLAHLDSDARSSLDAYASGVNAWIAEGRSLPIEFFALRFRPEPWTPADSLLQIKVMALDLDANYRLELTHSLWTKALGPRRAAELRPDYTKGSAGAIHAIEQISGRDLDRMMALDQRMQAVLRLGGAAPGSNAFVVSGQHTESGKPLLENDPHLKTQLPSIWFLAEVRGDRLQVVGATIPGIPLVLSGHNESIAWGVTALKADTQDLFIERMHFEDDNLYEVDGRWQPVQIDHQTIAVRRPFPSFLHAPLEPVRWPVRSTRNGPLISDVLPGAGANMALKWTALSEDDISYAAFFSLNYAQNWEHFRAAVKKHTAPSLNFVYADTAGNIGYSAAGGIPIRRSGDGSLPAAGWSSQFDWAGMIPADELPFGLNPPTGYIVSANNRVHDDNYRHFISRDWAPPFRANRIGEMISEYIDAGRKLRVDDVVRIVGDEKSLQASQLLPFLKTLVGETERQRMALEHLRQWDGAMAPDSVAASIYVSWLRHFNATLLEELMKTDALVGQRRIDGLYGQVYPLFLDQVVNGALRERCDNQDTPGVESCGDRALESLDAGLEDLDEIAGKRMNNWKWGHLHAAYYPHSLFSRIRMLDLIFDRTTPYGGDPYTVNVASPEFLPGQGYRTDTTASYRQVVDLGDWRRSGFITNTGQSGHIFSRHYDDFLTRQRDLSLLPMKFREEVVGKTLILCPAVSAACDF